MAKSHDSGDEILHLNEETPISFTETAGENEHAMDIPGRSGTQIALPSDVSKGVTAQSEFDVAGGSFGDAVPSLLGTQKVSAKDHTGRKIGFVRRRRAYHYFDNSESHSEVSAKDHTGRKIGFVRRRRPYHYFDNSESHSEVPAVGFVRRRRPYHYFDNSGSHSEGLMTVTERISIYREPLRSGTRVYKGIYKIVDGFERPIALKLAGFCSLAELKILSKLGSHPNVVQIIDMGECLMMSPEHYIAMELCSLQNLQDYLDERKKNNIPLDFDQTMNYSKQLVAGMQHIHNMEIIHGDLRPSNILFSVDMATLKITDFALSKRLPHGNCFTHVTNPDVVTIAFNAPETYLDHVISRNTDIYSLGISMHRLWSNGMHPFGVVRNIWISYIKKNKKPDFSGILIYGNKRDQLLNLLQHTLEFDPNKRPTIDEIAQDPFMSSAPTPTKSKALDCENATVLKEFYDEPAREIRAKESAQSARDPRLRTNLKRSKGKKSTQAKTSQDHGSEMTASQGKKSTQAKTSQDHGSEMTASQEHTGMPEDSDCTICYNPEPNELLPCGHSLCSGCIAELIQRIRCPYCRGEHMYSPSSVEQLLKKVFAEKLPKDTLTQLPESTCPISVTHQTGSQHPATTQSEITNVSTGVPQVDEQNPELLRSLELSTNPDVEGTSTTEQTEECFSNAEELEITNNSTGEPRIDQQKLELQHSSELSANSDAQGISTAEQTEECPSTVKEPSPVDSATETDEFEYGFTPVVKKNIIAVSGGELSIEDYKIEFPKDSVLENKEMAMSLEMDFREVQIPQHVVPVSAMIGVDYQGNLEKLASFSIPIWFVPADPSDQIMIFKSKPRKSQSDLLSFEHELDAKLHDGKVLFNSDHFCKRVAAVDSKKIKNGSLSLAHALLHSSCSFRVIICHSEPAKLLKEKVKRLCKDGYKKLFESCFELDVEECDVMLQSFAEIPYNFYPDIKKVKKAELLRCKKTKNNPLKIAINKTFVLTPSPKHSTTVHLNYTMNGSESEQLAPEVHPPQQPGPTPGFVILNQQGGSQSLDQSIGKEGVVTGGQIIGSGGQDNSTQHNTKNTAVVGDKVVSETLKTQNT